MLDFLCLSLISVSNFFISFHSLKSFLPFYLLFLLKFYLIFIYSCVVVNLVFIYLKLVFTFIFIESFYLLNHFISEFSNSDLYVLSYTVVFLNSFISF